MNPRLEMPEAPSGSLALAEQGFNGLNYKPS
jgi:hypothetical protein